MGINLAKSSPLVYTGSQLFESPNVPGSSSVRESLGTKLRKVHMYPSPSKLLKDSKRSMRPVVVS